MGTFAGFEIEVASNVMLFFTRNLWMENMHSILVRKMDLSMPEVAVVSDGHWLTI